MKLKGTIGLLLALLLPLIAMVLEIASISQYAEAKRGMVEHEAVVTDTQAAHGGRYFSRQRILISYTVDGKEYERQLGTDTAISVSGGFMKHYRKGDIVKICYDPQDPSRILEGRALAAQICMLIFACVVFLFFSGLLVLLRLPPPKRKRVHTHRKRK